MQTPKPEAKPKPVPQVADMPQKIGMLLAVNPTP